MDETSFQDLLLSLSIGDFSSSDIRSLYLLANSSELRDFQWKFELESKQYSLFGAFWSALDHLLSSYGSVDSNSDMHNCSTASSESELLSTWHILVRLPEFSASEALQAFTQVRFNPAMLFDHVEKLVSTFHVKENDVNSVNVLLERISMIGNIVHWLYVHNEDSRTTLRRLIGRVLLANHHVMSRFDCGYGRIHVDKFLKILTCIINGVQESFQINSMELVRNILIPLHQPNDMIEWRDQIPVIQSYHTALINCCLALINQESKYQGKPSLLFPVMVKGIISCWPKPTQANTMKEVLLIHEMETLLSSTTLFDIRPVFGLWLERWTKCISADGNNIRIVQRALQIFKNDKVIAMFCKCNESGNISENQDIIDNFYNRMLPALYKNGQTSWNPTVNKMIGLSIEKLNAMNEVAFCKFADELFTAKINSLTQLKDLNNHSQQDMTAPGKDSVSVPVSPFGLPRPPRVSPRPVAKSTPQDFQSTVPKPFAKGANPSVCVTGVAPWAFNTTMPTETGMATPFGALTAKPISRESAIQSLQSNPPVINRSTEHHETRVPGSTILLQFAARCMPKEQQLRPDEDWNMMQAAARVSRFELKFHDLVFGKELGKGAFSTVKYARAITRDKAQSQWPEFAIKIVSKDTLQHHDYHRAIEREMAVLQLIDHPGIARLVSSFRYNGSAYLVLEYASQGDLHTWVAENGTPVPKAMRFLLGEIVSALAYIHSQHLSFNDLKPENVLVTQNGHVKLSDFGACRAIDGETKKWLQSQAVSVDQLRDGDWRGHTDAQENKREHNMICDNSEDNEDRRIEITPSYQSPEILLGCEAPNQCSDSWSLGCLSWFVCRGRPPATGSTAQSVLRCLYQGGLIGEDLISARGRYGKEWSRIMALQDDPNTKVHFSDGHKHDDDASFDQYKFDSNTNTEDEEHNQFFRLFADFIKRLLQPEPNLRLNIEQASRHSFITNCGNISPSDFYELLKGEVLPGAGSNPQDSSMEDLVWSRRQFSVLWAPMPGTETSNVNDHNASQAKKIRNDYSRSYILSDIPETEIERLSAFF